MAGFLRLGARCHLNILALVRRMRTPVSGALGAVGLAFAATLAPVAMAPGVYALIGSCRQQSQPLDVNGRLVLIASGRRDAPGTLALWDGTTGTLIAGNLVSIDRVRDLRDVDGKGWPEALAALKATKCIHTVPAFGRISSCADIDALARYFAVLDGHERTLLAAGVGLAELPARCDLPEFAAWDGYAALQNANRAYLRMERDSFND